MKNETLEQRRKAQQSFLELKKMQTGEVAEVSASAEKTPKSFKSRFLNFWYYYKFAVIGVIITAAVVTFMCVQCAGKKEDDLRVVVFSNHIITENQTQQIKEYFEFLCEDYNNDGTKQVTVVNCTFETDRSTAEYQQTKMQKLQSLIAADTKASIFITTKETYDFINDLSDDGLLTEYTELNSDFYKEIDSDMEIELPDDLVISVRKIEGTLFEKSEEANEYNRRAEDFVFLYAKE